MGLEGAGGMGNKSEEKRMVHYDLLRIIAAFSVVMLHSSAQFWYSLDINSTEWKIADSYDALFRFGVPVFVMLSGALFLPKQRELSIKKLYTHNILRLAIIYVLWSCLYGLLDCTHFDFTQIGWKEVAKAMILGRYHLWFLPMIAGIYALLPILRTWVQNAERRNLEYFLALFFILQILSQTLRAAVPSDYLNRVLNTLQIDLVCGYVGYFVLGYYVVYIKIPSKYHKIIYISAFPAAVLNVVLGNYLSVRAGMAQGEIYDSFGLFTFCISLAVFLFFTEVMGKVRYSGKAERLIREVSAGTMGVYVMHIGMMEILEPYGIHSMMLPNIVGIPLYAVLCFVTCLAAASILRRVPVLGKYIC